MPGPGEDGVLAPGQPGGVSAGRPRRQDGSAEPTVLLVGADKSFHGAIAQALSTHGVYVETCSAHGVVDAVVAAAPDLVLLVGEAAVDGGSSVLAHLHTSPQSSVAPVAILADDSALDERLRAFRHGAAAVIPRSASVDAIADRVAKLAREIPDRDGGTVGYLGESTLEDLVQALSKELRSGILSVRGARGSEDDTIRVVLGGGRPLAQTIDEFVSRIRKHVVHAEPLHYEFDERAGGTVQLLGGDALDQASTSERVEGLRVLLADEDSVRADAVAQALRGHDATVVVTDFDPPDQRFARLRQLDPAILLIDEVGLRGAGYRLVRRMRQDTRLRWASLLVVRWEEIWSDTEGAARIARMIGTLSALAEPDRTLRDRAESGTAFDTRLEITGPARLLRTLSLCNHPLRLTVHNPRVQVRVDLSDHLVAGARAQAGDAGGAPLEGAVALSALLVLGSGRVHIERLSEAETVNVMSPVEVALSAADGESPPIQPSLPPPDSLRPGAAESSPPGESLPPRGRTGGALFLWGLVALASVVVGVSIAVLLVSGERREPGAAAPLGARAPAAALSGRAAASGMPVVPSTEPAVEATPAAPPAPPGAAEQKVPEGAAPSTDVAGEAAMKAKTCEEIVGPSWSLLGGDQPTRAAAELRLGRRGLMLAKLDEAQQAFCRAAVLDPTKPDAFESLVRLLLLRKDFAQAREWAERVAKQHPNDVDVQGLYGDALARVGDADHARSIWLGLGKVDPTDGRAVRMLGHTYASAGEKSLRAADQAQADRYYRRALLLDPLNATAAAGLARVLLVQDETKAALHWARRAVEIEPRDAQLHLMLGDVLEKLGEREAARAEWKTAFEIDPKNFRAASRMVRAGR